MSLEEEITDLISFSFSIKKEDIKRTLKLEDLGANPLDIAELHQDLEEKYILSITNDEAKHLKTLGNIVDYITKNQNTKDYSLEEQ
jgi:acyl carrier protein